MFAKIGILCADDREFAPFQEYIEQPVIAEKAMLHFVQGTLGGMPVVGLYSGVCKVNAAIAAQIMIDTFHVDVIINAGTAGGMDPSVRILDTVIATEAVYHDVAPHILTGFHPWMASEFFKADERLITLARRACMVSTVWFGRMATGEAFVAEEGRQAILDAYAPLSVDMETASIAHVCYVNRIPWIAIRTITDDAQHSGEGHFEVNCARAAEISAQLTAKLVEAISKEE